MTILTSASGARPLSLAKGETLIIRNYSGTEAVTGSTAAREDASSVLGAGAVVYGPQTVAATVTISTTGTLDHSSVMGDPLPAVPDSLPIVSAAVRCRISAGDAAVGSNNVTSTRIAEKTNVAGSAPQVEYWNGWVNAALSTAAQEVGSGSATTLRAALVTGVSGVALNQTGATVTPLTWFNAAACAAGFAWKLDGVAATAAEFVAAGGSVSADGLTITVPDGWRVLSDAATALSFAAGDRYYVQLEDSKAQGLRRPNIGVAQKTTLGDATRQQATTGTMVFSADWTGASQTNGAVITSPVNVWMTGAAGQKVAAIAGDSIITETGDVAVGTTTFEGDGDGCLAFANRALNAAGYSWVRTSVPGTKASNINQYGGHAQRLLSLRFASAVITNMGNNDRGLAWAGAAPTGFLATHRWYWQQLRAACLSGKGRVIQCTYSPKTTSTDTWATAANQTDNAAALQYSQYNPWYLARQFSRADGDPDEVFDFYGAMFSTQALNTASAVAVIGGQAAYTLVTDKLFPSNGTANSGSRDGTHPSGPLYAGVASVLKGQLPALCGF